MALQKVKTKGVKGRKKPKTHRMGFDSWENMEAVEDFKEKVGELVQKMVADMIVEGLEVASAEYKCWAWLDGRNVDLVEVEVPIGANEEDSPRWKWSLTELVEWDVEVCEDLTEGGKDKERLQALSDHLGKLKAIVDQALATE